MRDCKERVLSLSCTRARMPYLWRVDTEHDTSINTYEYISVLRCNRSSFIRLQIASSVIQKLLTATGQTIISSVWRAQQRNEKPKQHTSVIINRHHARAKNHPHAPPSVSSHSPPTTALCCVPLVLIVSCACRCPLAAVTQKQQHSITAPQSTPWERPPALSVRWVTHRNTVSTRRDVRVCKLYYGYTSILVVH